MANRNFPTTVANLHELETRYPGWGTDPNFAYVARPSSNTNNHYGNPFSHKPGTKAGIVLDSRNASVQAYLLWLLGLQHQEVEPQRRAELMGHLPELAGKTLVCFCAPQLCHGHVLAAMLDASNENLDPNLRRVATKFLSDLKDLRDSEFHSYLNPGQLEARLGGKSSKA